MYRSNMWALKNKSTGKLVTENEAMCLQVHDEYPMLFMSRNVARQNRGNHSVVKVAVNIRAA